MNDTHHFKLIDGTFTSTEASRVLLSLVKSKIDYHSMEKFSHEQRFGGDLSRSEKRLEDLKELETALKALFDSAADAKQTFKIDGWIEISFIE